MSQKSTSSVKKLLINFFWFLHILISFGHKLRKELTLFFVNLVKLVSKFRDGVTNGLVEHVYFCIFKSFSAQITFLQNIDFSHPIVRSNVSLYFLKNVHSSMCCCVSRRPVVQCLQCILSTQFDDLFPFMFSSTWDLYLNQILASDRVRLAR